MNITFKERAEANLEAAQRHLMDGKVEIAVDALITSISLMNKYIEGSLEHHDRKLDCIEDAQRGQKV